MWLERPSFCSTEEMQNGGRQKYQICVGRRGDFNVLTLVQLEWHVSLHVFHMVFHCKRFNCSNCIAAEDANVHSFAFNLAYSRWNSVKICATFGCSCLRNRLHSPDAYCAGSAVSVSSLSELHLPSALFLSSGKVGLVVVGCHLIRVSTAAPSTLLIFCHSPFFTPLCCPYIETYEQNATPKQHKDLLHLFPCYVCVPTPFNASLALHSAAWVIFIAQYLLVCLVWNKQVQCHGAEHPPTPPPLPHLLLPLFPLPLAPSALTDRQTHCSLFLCLSPLEPPSIHSAGRAQCRRSILRQGECSPELTISPRLPECRRVPLCSVRGELTPMSEPNE